MFIHLIDVFYTPFVIVALSILHREITSWAESNQSEVESTEKPEAQPKQPAVKLPTVTAEVKTPQAVKPPVVPSVKPAAQPKAKAPRPTLESVMRGEAKRRLGEAS